MSIGQNFIELVHNPLEVMAHDFVYTHSYMLHILCFVCSKLSINRNQVKEADQALQCKCHTKYLELIIGKHKMMKI